MNLTEAQAIYAKPNGHSKEALHECMRVLNDHWAGQHKEYPPYVIPALLDAKHRLEADDAVV